MCRSSSSRDHGSALIEAIVIGSFVFIIVLAAVSATIELSVVGGDAQESARVGAVHAARHAGPSSAEEFGGLGTRADRVGDSIRVVVVPAITVPHPDGTRGIGIAPSAAMPLAPFRSDRG